MATATDMIPVEAKIDIDQAYFSEDVENLAGDEKIVMEIKSSISDYDSRFISQREEWAQDTEGIWNEADAAFRCNVNDTSVQIQKVFGANEPDEWERAKVSTPQFYRQVTQMAANGYSVQTSRDMPFKYEALQDDTIAGDEQAENRAQNLNLLAKWSMKRDHFNMKSIEFWTQVKKYGNIPIMVEWIHRRGRKVVRIPTLNKDNSISGYELKEIDTVIENRPSMTILPIESVKADTVIGNLQDQECVIIQSIVGMTDIIDGIRSGFYREETIEELDRSHQWDGTSGFENTVDKNLNRGFNSDGPTTSNTGQYLKREVFINAPIENKKWDEKKNLPVRYRVTMFGNNPNNSVVARIERNQEPDDTIPVEMIHANPDDSNMLYHISPFEVIRPNLAVETTIKRQIIDNNTLVCKPPLKEIQDEVYGNDRTFSPNQRFICDNQDSISEFTIRDISSTSVPLLQMIAEESNNANMLDKNMLGDSYGARTSATEAGTISSHSQRPTLTNIEYILDQYLSFYAKRVKVGWEAFGLPEQVIQITDENDTLMFVKPTDIYGEFDIVVDIMEDIVENAADATRIVNYAQVVAKTPMAESTNWVMLNEALSEKMLGTSKHVAGSDGGDAEALARANLHGILQGGIPPQFGPGMNLQKHLDIYKSERKRWMGREDQNANIELLDRVIEQLEQYVAAQQGGGGPTPVGASASPTPQGNTEVNRQELSGAAGGEGGI